MIVIEYRVTLGYGCALYYELDDPDICSPHRNRMSRLGTPCVRCTPNVGGAGKRDRRRRLLSSARAGPVYRHRYARADEQTDRHTRTHTAE